MPTTDTKLIKDIRGTFHVPSYQRGYRWGKEEVERLLNDIRENVPEEVNGDTRFHSYCLQPIVVKRKERTENEYELIDGQQRLTTLYLIYLYLSEQNCKLLPKYNMLYEIKPETESYLQELNKEHGDRHKEDNIDFWFLKQAYETIKDWFKDKEENDFKYWLDNKVKVIWYEPEESEDSVSLFTRLNIGKIPLTNAELVKALFLKEQAFDPKTQKEIALQWDLIETELHDDDLWYFLTKGENTGYQTRIDLVLDLIAEQIKKEDDVLRNSNDKYVTFFCFAKQSDLKEQWKKIHKTFLRLKDWYEDHELYHKIGYLIASETCTIKEIYDLSKEKKTKTEFKKSLDQTIKKSIDFKKDYADLTYENQTDCKKISTLLLLFNVESVRRIDNKDKEKDIRAGTQRFPFRIYKARKWSLEHIHAQQSEVLTKNEERKEWLESHLPYIEKLNYGTDKDKEKNELVEGIKTAINELEKNKDLGERFSEIQKKTFPFLCEAEDAPYLHSIANLALLAKNNNSALSNSLFCVKRGKIIEYDMDGEYIPLCTKRVFLKYYTKENNQFDFWGEKDRKDYIKAICEVLKDYLDDKIKMEKNNG